MAGASAAIPITAIRPLAADASPIGSNKLSNLSRLCSLSDELGFAVPETYALGAAHFDAALTTVVPGGRGRLATDVLNEADVDAIRQQLLLRPLADDTRRVLAGIFEALSVPAPSSALCVRSCFELEDLASRSFAGVFETVLSVTDVDTLYRAVQVVYASVFSQRAFAEIRSAKLAAFPAMSIAVQRMVGGAGWLGGVAHTQCPDLAPFPLMSVSVSATTDAVTSGSEIPEDYLVSRPALEQSNRRVILQAQPGSSTQQRFALDDARMRTLASTLVRIEEAFERPLEVEYYLAPDDRLHVLQARPIAVSPGARLQPTQPGTDHPPLCSGLPVGSGRVTARARRVHSLDQALHVPPGAIIVAENTDPDWLPVIRRAAGLVTSIGARTSHVSRAARETGVLAVVGCGDAIDALEDGQRVTLVCAEGLHGGVYAGDLPSEALSWPTEDVHISTVSRAFTLARGAQPRRVIFDLSNVLLAYRLPDPDTPVSELPMRLQRRIAGYADVASFALAKLIEAVCLAGIAFPGAELCVRMHPSSGWISLLPALARHCRADYGLSLTVLSDYPAADSLPRT